MSTSIARRGDVFLIDPAARKAFVLAVLGAEGTKNAGKANDLLVKIQAGAEQGMAPFQAINSFHIIDGNLAMTARAMSALVTGSKNFRYQVSEETDEKITLDWFEIIDSNRVKIGSSSFSMTEAKNQGLVKDKSAWKKCPVDMLFARALSRGFRRFCPHLTNGNPTYLFEELDSEEVSDVEFKIRTPEETEKEIEELLTSTGANKQAILDHFGVKAVSELNATQRIDLIKHLKLKGGK